MKKFLIVILLFLVSCGVETPSPTLTPTPTAISTPYPPPLSTSTAIFRVPMEVEEVYKFYFPLIYNSEDIKSIGNEFIKHDIDFGFAVNSGIRTNTVQREIVTYHAKVVTMENDYKMKRTQLVKGVFNFWSADQIILFGNENNIDVYGHGVSWALFNPAWVNNIPDSELAYELSNHVRIVCSHYRNLSGMDVANEAYAGGVRPLGIESTSLSAGPWSPLGNDYINISFNSCRNVSSTKVFYNSFFPHYTDVTQAIQLLDSGLADGIGIQFHLSEGVDYQGLFNRAEYIIQESRKRGTPVRFSEVGVWATSDETQANIYRDVVRLALDNNDVVTDFIIWGTTDPSWRGNVTLFNSDGSPKQSAYAILDELAED